MSKHLDTPESTYAGLREWQEMAGAAFVRGVVLHTGRETANFGPGLSALPLSAIWRTPA